MSKVSVYIPADQRSNATRNREPIHDDAVPTGIRAQGLLRDVVEASIVAEVG